MRGILEIIAALLFIVCWISVVGLTIAALIKVVFFL